jgi:3-dehydroquinate dehydratase
MHAFVQSVEAVVVALAAAAFAHFGVTLKDAPAPKAVPAVERLQIDSAVKVRSAPRTPCPLAKGEQRA